MSDYSWEGSEVSRVRNAFKIKAHGLSVRTDDPEVLTHNKFDIFLTHSVVHLVYTAVCGKNYIKTCFGRIFLLNPGNLFDALSDSPPVLFAIGIGYENVSPASNMTGVCFLYEF